MKNHALTCLVNPLAAFRIEFSNLLIGKLIVAVRSVYVPFFDACLFTF